MEGEFEAESCTPEGENEELQSGQESCPRCMWESGHNFLSALHLVPRVSQRPVSARSQEGRGWPQRDGGVGLDLHLAADPGLKACVQSHAGG